MFAGVEPKFKVPAETLQAVVSVALTVKEYWLVCDPVGQVPDVESYCSSLLLLPEKLSEYEPGTAVCWLPCRTA